MNNINKIKLKNIVMASLMTAVICVVSPFTIAVPISPVPISLSNFIIYLAIIVYEFKYTLLSTILYVLMGFLGLPVFSGFAGGVFKIFGPTGGYIIGYIFLVIASYGILHLSKKNSFVIQFISLMIGTIALYTIGTIWLCLQLNMTLIASIYAGVVPFFVFDLFKMIIAVIVGNKLKLILKETLIKCNIS